MEAVTTSKNYSQKKKKKKNPESHMPCIPVLTVIVFSHINKLDLYIHIHNSNSFHAQYVNIHIFFYQYPFLICILSPPQLTIKDT